MPVKSTLARLRDLYPLVITLIILILVLTPPAHAQKAKRIAIVSIDQSPATQRTIKGIKKSLKFYGVDASYKEPVITGNPKSDNEILASLYDFDPDLFITIGSYATLRVSKNFPKRPIIFANVLNPMASGFINSVNRPGSNITGASLDIPLEIQFNYFKRVVGSIKKMGVLYSSETENIIKQAAIAARQLGIELVAIRIESEKDIPQALDSLCRISDAIWSVADQLVYTSRSTKHIVLQTLRHGLPMMGFSQSLVEAGGLFTLDFDFKDVGRQAGEIAVRVLHGTSPSVIPTSTPGIIYFKYNEKTANRIKITIPDDLLAVAKEVIK